MRRSRKVMGVEEKKGEREGRKKLKVVKDEEYFGKIKIRNKIGGKKRI